MLPILLNCIPAFPFHPRKSFIPANAGGQRDKNATFSELQPAADASKGRRRRPCQSALPLLKSSLACLKWGEGGQGPGASLTGLRLSPLSSRVTDHFTARLIGIAARQLVPSDFWTQIEAGIGLASVWSLTLASLPTFCIFWLALEQELVFLHSGGPLPHSQPSNACLRPLQCVVRCLEVLCVVGPHEKGVRELGFLFLNMHEKSLEDWKFVLTRRQSWELYVKCNCPTMPSWFGGWRS